MVNVSLENMIEAKYLLVQISRKLEMVQHHLKDASTKELREQLASEMLEARLDASRIQRLLPTQEG